MVAYSVTSHSRSGHWLLLKITFLLGSFLVLATSTASLRAPACANPVVSGLANTFKHLLNFVLQLTDMLNRVNTKFGNTEAREDDLSPEMST